MGFLKAMKLIEDREGVRLKVYVQPRARKDAILGTHGDALKVSIKAPPVGGAANRELRRFLARVFDISPSQVAILSGHTSRHKMAEIRGLPLNRVRALLLPDEAGKGSPEF